MCVALCLCELGIWYVCVLFVIYCVMLYGVALFVLFVSVLVLVCFACDAWRDGVWFVCCCCVRVCCC